MKTTKIIMCTSAVLLLAAAIYAEKAPEIILPAVTETFAADKTNRQLGYQLIDSAEKIVFVFDSSIYKIKKPKSVFVEGSFNGWSKGKDASWQLSKQKGSIWTLERSSADVKIPGNSGFPEFKYYVIAETTRTIEINGEQVTRTREDTIEPNAVSKIPGYQMATNNLILFPGDDPATVIENTVTAERLKKLAEFDLEDPAHRAVISNVRLVPGTSRLFRGYHPYKMSRRQYDTEEMRIELVKKALEENGIKSVITLSGDEKPASGREEISPYFQAIRSAGNQLIVDTSYNTVYYHSAEADFSELMGTVISFINSHPGPYYIHCRLGTDRTGATSGVLAALCGASWESICADYQKTNEMGIKEFRDYRLLQYSFEQMLGKPISEVQNLQKEMGAYFINAGVLTQSDLDRLASQLK